MENASKALLIAGGILLALMTLSLVVYMSTATSRMIDAQDEKKSAEELTAFNMEYEAYNKTRMYGTDIITVVNKAINYNGKLIPAEASQAITIEFVTIDTFEASEQIITTDKNTGKITKNASKKLGGLSLGAGSYTVNKSSSKKVVEFFQEQEVEDTEEIDETARQTTKKITYSALANFKRVIFECTACEDRNKDGRIDYMKFEQYKTLNDIDM